MNTMEHSWKKRFFIIFLGQTFSIIGSAAVQFAIIWHLTARTGSAVKLSAAAIAGYLPGILFGTFAGVYIDRNKKRTVMVLADGSIAFSSLIMAAAFILTGIGIVPLWFWQTCQLRFQALSWQLHF